MGFLNHATNNIIIDAVLTERGRELLALNNGSFSIESFSFGDDEVDYSLIKKYGRTIGKEKIIKNTPIFEANPNENIAIKHPLISFTNPLTRISALPKLARDLTTDGLNSEVELTDSSEGAAGRISPAVTIITSLTGIDSNESLEGNITDTRFLLKFHSELISVSGSGASFIDTDLNGISTFSISTADRTSPDWLNQKTATFNITAVGVTTSSAYTKFSSIGNVNQINTSVQVIGEFSGASIVVPVKITKFTTQS